MRELAEGEQRPVWVKAVLVKDGAVEKIFPTDADEEVQWQWMIYAMDVQHVPRARQGLEEDTTVMPPDMVAHTTHSLFPEWVNDGA